MRFSARSSAAASLGRSGLAAKPISASRRTMSRSETRPASKSTTTRRSGNAIRTLSIPSTLQRCASITQMQAAHWSPSTRSPAVRLPSPPSVRSERNAASISFDSRTPLSSRTASSVFARAPGGAARWRYQSESPWASSISAAARQPMQHIARRSPRTCAKSGGPSGTSSPQWKQDSGSGVTAARLIGRARGSLRFPARPRPRGDRRSPRWRCSHRPKPPSGTG